MNYFSIDNFNQKKKISWKWFLNWELKQRFLIVYINVPDLYFVFLPCINLTELWKIRFCIFLVGILRFCFLYYTWICKYMFKQLASAAIQSNVCRTFSGSDTRWPCWINHASVHSIDSANLRFNAQVTMLLFGILLFQ